MTLDEYHERYACRPSDWPAIDRSILSLWQEGKSRHAIGLELSRKSGAVMARIWRLRRAGVVAPDGTPLREPGSCGRSMKAAKSKIKKMRLADMKRGMAPSAADLPGDDPVGKPLVASIIELERGQCSWPIGEGYCGRSTEGRWCDPHHARGHQAPAK